MNKEYSRRSSTTAFAAGDSAPRAPPLPAPKSLQRARDAATRLFGYSSRPPSPQGEGRITYGRATRFASLSATHNASTSHRTGLQINTVSINEAGTHALIGGKEIFKTVKVEEGTCAEEFNLRSAIRSTPTQASGKARQIYSINIADVAWAKGDCGDYVAAATSSGKIILYDLGHAGLQAAQLHEHARQVHRVTFNPHRGSLLLSGSQDGTVRLWDVREVREVRHASTLKSRHRYSGQADGIRDVKWSPTDGVDFAFGTDSGWIQRWDMRNLKTAKVKMSAHGETCTAIDWHPDGKHIASASADKTVRVWDFSSTHRQKEKWSIRTPHPVSNARWRPSCDSPMPYDSGARQCTQLVTAYDASHPVLHLWDLRRPALPFREFWPGLTAPTDLLWHSQDLLWTVGKEGVFLQTDIQYATKSISKRNLQAISVSPRGELDFATQRRRRQRPAGQHGSPLLKHKSSNLSSSPEHSTLSRSWADDGLDQSFLSAAHAKQIRTSKAKSRAQSLSMAVASNDFNAQVPTAQLSDVLSTRRSYRPPQAGVRGLLDNYVDPLEFEYLAEHLRYDLLPILNGEDVLAAFDELLARNVKVNEVVGMYRLAQSWRVLSLVVKDHLHARGRAKLQQVSTPKELKGQPGQPSDFRHIADKLLDGQFEGSAPSVPVGKPRSSLAQQLALSDSASYQRTPQAQPRPDVRSIQLASVTPSGDTDDIEQLTLPAIVLNKSAAQPKVPQEPENDPKLTRRNLDGLQEQQRPDRMDRADMVRRWSVQPKEPLSLDSVDPVGVWMPPKLQKHDSNESFAFLAESADSRGPSFPSSVNSSESTSGRLRLVAERPSRAQLKDEQKLGGVETQDFGAGSNGITTQQDHSRDARSPPQRPPAPELMPKDTEEHHVLPNQAEESQGSPHDEFGSYPDENGISPVIELKAAMSSPRNRAPETIQAALPPRPTATKNGVRDGSVSRLSVEKAPARRPRNSQLSFLPEDDDPDVEVGKPFTMRDVVQELASEYCLRGNAQNASVLYLLLGPLLPRTRPLTDCETEATISAYVDCLSCAGFAKEDIEAILDGYLAPLVTSGLQALQVEAVLATYHDQLSMHGLLNEAAALRKLSYPMYPSVYDQGLVNNTVHLMCGKCRKPVVDGMSDLCCESCNVKQAICPVCWCESGPFSFGGTPTDATHLLTTCLLCNHSGHAGCLQMWFKDAQEHDGGCPTPGCLCDCVAGTWRKQKVHMAEKRRRSRGHGRVKSDDWPVEESNAVERTRTVLNAKTARDNRSGSGP